MGHEKQLKFNEKLQQALRKLEELLIKVTLNC